MLYIWDTNADVFNIYKIARQFMNELYILDSNILLALIKEKGCSIEQTLAKIPYMHQAYVEQITPSTES